MTAAASSRVAVSSPPRVAARVGAGRRSPKTYSETRQRARPADPAFDPSRHHRGRRSRLFLTIARANPLRSFDPEEVTIEGLVPLDQICDEFVCKSSPAVEASLRQIATDVCALRENARSLTPFANDIEYDDGARVFKGREGFKNHAFIAENIGNPAAAVESMRMNAVDEAVIEWRLRGQTPGGALDAKITSTLTMNLITGRATRWTEAWDVAGGGSDPGAAAFVASTRKASALPKNAADAATAVAKELDDALGSVAGSLGLGGEEREVQVDPNDPMKFFTNANGPKDDFLQLALFASAIYLVVRLLQETSSLN